MLSCASCRSVSPSNVPFIQDLVHEGLPVAADSPSPKHVLSLNLWATRREPSIPRIVHFTFPSEDAAAPAAASDAGASAGPLARLAASPRSFALPMASLSRFPHCVLAGLAEVAASSPQIGDGSNGGGGAAPVISLPITQVASSAFATVFAALSGAYVSVADLRTHAHALDFFSVPLESVLVNTANKEAAAGGAAAAAAASAAAAGAAKPSAAGGCCSWCGRAPMQVLAGTSSSTSFAPCARGCGISSAVYCSRLCAEAHFTKGGHAAACGAKAPLFVGLRSSAPQPPPPARGSLASFFKSPPPLPQVYGHCNFLQLSGVVRLAGTMPGGAADGQ